MKKKVKRYNEGGKTEEEYKKEGLAASNKEERVGLFERLRMGNIDSPGSEAYYKFGAGRGRLEEESKKKVPESANKSSDYSGRNMKSPDPDRHLGLGMAGNKPDKEDKPTVKPESAPAPAPAPRNDSSRSSEPTSSYTAPSTYKQPPIGDATNDNIVAKRRAGPKKPDDSKKPDAPKKSDASKKPNAPKTIAGSGLAGSDKGSKASDKYKDIPVRKIGKAIEDTFSNAFKRVDPEAIREERRRIVERKRKRDKAGESATDNMKEFGMKRGGSVSSASSRGDGIAQRGKTRGRLV